MLPSRYAPGQSSAIRKSRLEGKPSMLPKPRRPGSTDRLSTEARRPSAAGYRSSSADPPRATYAGGRLSREASATKLPFNGRSRSQQGDRFGQPATTPLRSSHYSRPTTTPVRTPSGDRSSRSSWQASLDRALAFVTSKDQRPISNVAWQRAECARVQEALAARGEAGGRAALTRPLTIARFVDVTGSLLAAITKDTKLNTDNYVTKLPHVSKRLLYPGTVSKSWLKTVNTLHAFPHALALIAYLLDLLNHLEMPVTGDWFYLGKDEVSRLRREYLHVCWLRFQVPGHQFEDLKEEYLHNLKMLLGNDEEKIADLQQTIKKYTACLEDEAEAAARAEESRRNARRDGLLAAVRSERAARLATQTDVSARRAHRADVVDGQRLTDAELERAQAENQQLKLELEQQTMSVEERTRLADQVDYYHRLYDSRASLLENVSKMVFMKENELARWQKTTLDTCVEYKQGLIHLSAQFPELAALHIDEKELMGESCVSRMSSAVEALRAAAARLHDRRHEHAQRRTALSRKTDILLKETRVNIEETTASLSREQPLLDGELSKEASEAAAYSQELADITARLQELASSQDSYLRTDNELQFWETQDDKWRSKLAAMRNYIETQKMESQRLTEIARTKREQLIMDCVNTWSKKLEQ